MVGRAVVSGILSNGIFLGCALASNGSLDVSQQHSGLWTKDSRSFYTRSGLVGTGFSAAFRNEFAECDEYTCDSHHKSGYVPDPVSVGQHMADAAEEMAR